MKTVLCMKQIKLQDNSKTIFYKDILGFQIYY